MKGAVYINGILAGEIEKDNNAIYTFRYDDGYILNEKYPSISLTLPKKQREFRSGDLFSFFYGLLSEGVNKDIQCRLLKIDQEDDFTRLLQTTGDDTIGAITIKPMDDAM
ncbi:MAG: HipA N-terminal domain-containing protein [Bacteroidota bacterium]